MFDIFCPKYEEGVNGKTTSPQSGLYNCVAHSVGASLFYIWPDADEEYGWPEHIPRDDSRSAFIGFYRLCGFEPCNDASPEPGYEKVVIYELAGRVAHVALQSDDGTWSSKIGDLTDVMHRRLDVVASAHNGQPAQAMRRRRTGAPPQLPALHPPQTVLVNPSGVPLSKLAAKP